MRLAQNPAEEIDEAARPGRHRFAMQKGVEIVRQFRRAGVAVFRAFLLALPANKFEIDIDLRVQGPRPHRFLGALSSSSVSTADAAMNGGRSPNSSNRIAPRL